MKVWFFGSDKYSQVVLNSLKNWPKIEIKKIITPQTLLSLNLEEQEKPIVGILASFGAIIPKKVLDFPLYGILNLHPSLLPKYRGPSPVQYAILNGDSSTGLTIIKMDEKIDHGPVIAQFEEEILPQDDAETLYFRLFSGGAEALKTILFPYLEGKIFPQPQDESQATYTRKITKDDGFIPFEKLKSALKGENFPPFEVLGFKIQTPAQIEKMTKAFSPWPGTWTKIKLKSPNSNVKSTSSSIQNKNEKWQRLKILKAHLENGKLLLDLVQLEGKKPVKFKQFLEGYPQVEWF